LALTLRIYLAGRLCIESGATLLDERQLPRRQGRLALAVLAAEHARAISRDELADVLWPHDLPAAWEVALRAVISKLRTVLRGAGWPYAEPIESAFGCYQLRVPPATWIDIDVAEDSVHRAEALLSRGDTRSAYGWAVVASSIARRPFLPADEGPWVDGRRELLRTCLIRALDCVAAACAASGEHSLALKNAKEAVVLEPLREAGYQRLMQLHAAMGERALALQTYRRCAEVLASELGVAPSTETRAVLAAIGDFQP
jgi:DNA-binding SARP family transcriptional activator